MVTGALAGLRQRRSRGVNRNQLEAYGSFGKKTPAPDSKTLRMHRHSGLTLPIEARAQPPWKLSKAVREY